MDYSRISELVKRAKYGDKLALEELIKSYDNLIKKYSKRFFVSGFDEEDLQQISAMAIMQCALKFDTSVGANFTGFAERVIRNTLINMINKKENKIYNTSLETPVEDGIEIKNTIPDDFNIEESIVEDEEIKELREALMQLTKEEQQLLYAAYGQRGALNEYAKARGMSYRKCAYKRDKLIDKLRKIIK